jgi:regulator of sirC expression with transglutaminase-like and TPR domain
MSNLHPLDALGLAEDADLAIDAAALLLAAEDRPGLAPEDALALLPDATPVAEAALLRAGADGRRLPTEQDWAAAVGQHVCRTMGLAGDRASYDAPENADLLDVLRRKRGLPVALAIIGAGLVRRAGGRAEVLGLPGHAVMQVGTEEGAVWLDLFNGPQALDAAGLGRSVQRAMGRHVQLTVEDLRPLSNRATVIRLVNNQVVRARKAGQAGRALTLLTRLSRIAPGEPALWWERARLEHLAGDRTSARASLAAMRETTRDPALMRRIAAAEEAIDR